MATHIFYIRSDYPTERDADLRAKYATPTDTYTVLRDKVEADNTNLIVNAQMYVGQECFPDPKIVWKIHRSFVAIPTSIIPESATIVSASLSVKALILATDKVFNVVIQQGSEGIHHQPPIAADYNRANISGDGGSVSSADAIYGEFLVIPLSEDGISWIDKGEGALTKLCLRSSDDIAGTAPTEVNEYIRFYSGNHYTTENKPILAIEIAITTPSVTTHAADYIISIGANLNGEITDAGHWYDSYGFEYKEGLEGEVISVVDGSSGYYTTKEFDKYVFPLSPSTLYYYRAWASNDAGKGYGDWVSFTTLNVIPVVTTQGASVPVAVPNPAYYEWATGNGTIVSVGNDTITERGFEIVVEFSGDLYDSIQHSIAGFEGTASWDWDAWAYVGTLTKTETEDNGFGDYFDVGAYDMELGSFPSTFSDMLFAGETYKYRAFITNNEDTYYGDYVNFTIDTWTPEDGDDSVNDDLSDGDPCVPIIPIDITEDELPEFWWEPEEPIWDIPELPELPELPPWYLPDLPEWEWPDYPVPSFVGDFYYRKPYTKKDLDYLRKKCIIYNKNSVEFALVLRHNMNVLREFFNMMTDYMSKDEFNDFTDLIPPQRLKELSLDPLEPTDFRDMINGFIRNTVDNNMAVNRNFNLIQDGLSDYETGSDDAHFRNIVSNMKQLEQDNPDVERMKRLIDNLNYEVAMNFNNIMHNLSVVRARLL